VYTAKDLEQIAAHAVSTHCTAILTTEKDWVKWQALLVAKTRAVLNLPVYRPVLTIEFLDGGPAITALLRSACGIG
jgi:tetraacyldisaccharide-1-P 4'-kinase